MSASNNVRIRMYRQGLGDCFLVSFFNQGGKKPFHMLIDCGVLLGTENAEQKMMEVAGNIKEETNGNIDLLIATHEHWDHLSGFVQAETVFETIKIKEIWMAWTEDPDNDLANKLKENQNEKLKALQLAFHEIEKAEIRADQAKTVGIQNYLNAFAGFFSFYGLNSSGLPARQTTADAFDKLRKHKNARITYCYPEALPIEIRELPGVRFYILGPPQDEKALRKMNPSKSGNEVYTEFALTAFGESFLAALNSKSDILTEDLFKPFTANHYDGDASISKLYKEYIKPKNQWRAIDDDWLYMAGGLAIDLDNETNNTCLAIAIELIGSGKVLLFPGDAQVGNWLSWWNYEWTIKNDGKKEAIGIEDLLNRTVFYKVGHHGSHNATLREKGLEKMTSNELIAMIPVDQTMAKERRWKMPFKPLLQELEKRTKKKVVIMDEDIPEVIESQKKQWGVLKHELFYEITI